MNCRAMVGGLAATLLLAHGAYAQAPKSAPNPVGTFRGTSICLVRPSPCHDETTVYRIAHLNSADSLSLDAAKIVNGAEDNMGILGCRLDASGSHFSCAIPNGVWDFVVRGDSLIGELKQRDGTKFRDVRAVRSR